MNFLPIAIRELQAAARRPMTYFGRCLNALMAACVTLGCLLVGFSGAVSSASAGVMTFQILSGIGYGVTAVGAVVATSDCISQERREGTLGLLFLTDLKGYDIILGKLSLMSGPVFGLLAAFPALGFTILLGGVTLGAFAMIALALVNALFFFSALGLLISALSWDGRAAVSTGMMGVVLCTAPMAASLAGLNMGGPWMFVLLPSPAGAFLAALVPAARTVAKPGFFESLMVSHALGWLLLALASRAVARNFSREEPPPERTPAPAQVPPGPNPSIVLHARSMSRKPWRAVWLLAAQTGAIVLIVALIDPRDWYGIPLFAGIVLALHGTFKFWMAHAACRSLPSRRRAGELELLLTTPLDGDAILLGSTTALKFQLLRPFLFVLGMDLLLLVLGWRVAGLWLGFAFGGAMLLEFLWFIGNLYTLTWVGLWMGLTASSHAKALGRTLFYLLLLPWLGLAVAAAFVGIMTLGRNLDPWMAAVTVVEFFVSLVVCNLAFTGWAVSELRDHFRLLAVREPLPRNKSNPPSWRRLLGKPRSGRSKRAPQPA